VLSVGSSCCNFGKLLKANKQFGNYFIWREKKCNYVHILPSYLLQAEYQMKLLLGEVTHVFSFLPVSEV
jgi:hypothetical protein